MEKYILAPYIACGFYQDSLDMGFGSILVTIEDKIAQEAYLNTAIFMKTPRTIHELQAFIFDETKATNKEDIYETFLSKNFLIKADEFDENERYNRNHMYYNLSGKDPRLVQKNLESKHVVILGCGGIGNIIAANLATSGIGRLTLTDNDHIELSNLTRQILFTENDVGNKKIITLKKALAARNHQVSIDTIPILFDSYEKISQLPECDLIVASGDSEHICTYLNQHCHEKNTPFINVGYIQDIACWGPLIIPSVTGCYNCFSSNHIANQPNPLRHLVKQINKDYKAPSFGAINLLAASAATLDIIKFLGDFGTIQSLNKRIGIWTHDLKIEYQYYQSKPGCKLCAN